MSLGLLLAVAGFSAMLMMVAALLMLRVSDNDVRLAVRVDAAHGRWAVQEAKAAPGVGAAQALQRAVMALGRAVMRSGVLPGRTRAELQQTLSAAGFRGANALALFVGSKLSMLFGMPVLGWLLWQNMQLATLTGSAMVGGLAVLGLVAPDMIIQRMRTRYLKRLESGLADALDMMVICAQAGLSLEPAMLRVALELRPVHPEMCLELSTTVRELEMMSSAAAALANMGQRTGLESLTRLGATLTQTMQYGTPLSESLRVLSNEMRTAALTRFEERAARLPVLLTMPMIIFILPCVFMIVGGPAAIQIGRSFSG